MDGLPSAVPYADGRVLRRARGLAALRLVVFIAATSVAVAFVAAIVLAVIAERLGAIGG